MAPAPHRFSSWDGTQEPWGPDLDDVFNRLSEDVFQGWDFDSALRRLLAEGWQSEQGSRLIGLEKMTERLRRQRQQQLERYSLDSVFADIEEKLNAVLGHERRGIDERLSQAGDGAGRRVLEKVAEKRRQQLDRLPERPAGAIRALQEYEFMDRRAEQEFHSLLEEVKRSVVDSQFQQMASRLSSMSPAEMDRLRRMTHDLNALLRKKLEGASPAELQRDYEQFLSQWGSIFPQAPDTFEAFLDDLQRQMARTDSLMQSLSPEARRELEDLMDTTFGQGEMAAEMAQLAGALELLSPRGRLGSQYPFRGSEQVSLEGAMGVMDRLQSLEELERTLRAVYGGEQVDPAAQQALEAALGEEMSRSLEGMRQITSELQRQGIVTRTDRGLQITARGLRRIGQKALNDLFSRLNRDRFGNHPVEREGRGGQRGDQSGPYRFGDAFDLDVQRTVMNALRREAAEPAPAPRTSDHRPRLTAGDFEVYGTEMLARSSTVLMLDMSRSMPLRGYFYAAKKVALALDTLIKSQYPRDSLHVIGFAQRGQEISSAALPHLSVDEYVYGTNLQHGLMLARRLLSRAPAGNKQIIIITDGEPTAHHTDSGEFVFEYPPLAETISRTLLEVRRCTAERIVINTFMLESNHRLVDFVDQMTRINRGRAFFISPEHLGDYLLVDYVSGRRRAA